MKRIRMILVVTVVLLAISLGLAMAKIWSLWQEARTKDKELKGLKVEIQMIQRDLDQAKSKVAVLQSSKPEVVKDTTGFQVLDHLGLKDEAVLKPGQVYQKGWKFKADFSDGLYYFYRIEGIGQSRIKIPNGRNLYHEAWFDGKVTAPIEEGKYFCVYQLRGPEGDVQGATLKFSFEVRK